MVMTYAKPRAEHSHKPCSTIASRPRCVMRYWTESVPIGRATTKPPLAKRSRVTRLLNSPTLRPISPAAFSCFKSSRSPRVRTKLHPKTFAALRDENRGRFGVAGGDLFARFAFCQTTSTPLPRSLISMQVTAPPCRTCSRAYFSAAALSLASNTRRHWLTYRPKLAPGRG